MLDQPTRRWFNRYRMELTIPVAFLIGSIGIIAEIAGFFEAGEIIVYGTAFTMAVTCSIIIVSPVTEMLTDIWTSWRNRYRDQG